MHGCDVEVTPQSRAPSAVSDEAIANVVAEVAAADDRVTSVLDRDDLGGSEDATYLMQRVQEQGGLAAYVGVGTSHPGGHHTGTFDVDEESLDIGIAVLSEAVVELAKRRPTTESEA
jgi:aminobenzoyl-glutamate utilization protein A